MCCLTTEEVMFKFKGPTYERRVRIDLSHDEAMVLFEWLHMIEDEDIDLPTRHPSEGVALLKLSGRLESALSAPFAENYEELLNQARERLAPEE